ncbi:MAG: hypothetical protein HMLKMBBP_00419 [Planctomycetes bacterium]|nr:hypothetical protein [Planctomycetota bacterium]
MNRLFGRAVAISGDAALVYEVNLDSDRGRVFVFRRNGTEWSYSESLLPAVRFPGDFFGSDMALDDEVALIGAFGDPLNVETAHNDRSGSIFLLNLTQP